MCVEMVWESVKLRFELLTKALFFLAQSVFADFHRYRFLHDCCGLDIFSLLDRVSTQGVLLIF